MPLRVQPITSGLTAATAPSATLPFPSAATDGVDITVWRPLPPYTLSFNAATVYLTTDAAATAGDSTHPVYAFGYRNSTWWMIGMLDSGQPIVFPTGALHAARRLDSIGIFERLAIACATLSTGNWSYQFEPIAEHWNG
jgi:hypothetical protein